jgi:hypothetical protein
VALFADCTGAVRIDRGDSVASATIAAFVMAEWSPQRRKPSSSTSHSPLASIARTELRRSPSKRPVFPQSAPDPKYLQKYFQPKK